MPSYLKLPRAGSRWVSAVAMAVLMFAMGSRAAAACEVDQPIRFSGLNWESNLLMVGIERTLLEKGFGCQTSIVQGETLPMLAALQRGDVEITAEVWPGQIAGAWKKALDSGKVIGVGHAFDAGEAWYIPRYMAERYPALKKASDLAALKEALRDPEDPSKGRIYGCPAGWACGTLNDNLLRALDLQASFNMFAPGAGAAQKAAILSAYKRKRDIVFYYWTPSTLIGALDVVKLELPAFDEAAFACLTDSQCAHPVATEFKPQPVITGMNAAFAQRAPTIRALFEKISVPQAAMDDTLGWMEKENKQPEDAAAYFMVHHADVWRSWVSEDVARRVAQGLQ